MGRLLQLELENFKSYCGKQIIGPFDNFTCIIGPNGAGKSNMMDAISFVLGVQSKHLRSSHLKELIFRKSLDSPPARQATVKLLYCVSHNEVSNRKEGSIIQFQRSVNASGVGDYFIDSKKVTFSAYENLLQEIGVLVKARNFLVFQGDVETVASKSPLELSKLLEQISGSDLLCEEYEDLHRKRELAEENTIFSMQKKKMYQAQCKEIKGQKDEAEAFQQKQNELADLRTEHVLWQLWRIMTEIEEHDKAMQQLKTNITTVVSREMDIDEELKHGKIEMAKMDKAYASAEKNLMKEQQKLDSELPKLSETRAKIKSLSKRIQEIEKNRGKVTKDLATQSEIVNGLKKEHHKYVQMEASIRAELDSADSGVTMTKDNRVEYSRLREEVSSRTASDHANELTIDMELQSKRQQLQRLETQHIALEQELNSSHKISTEYEERIKKLRGTISSNEVERAALVEERDRRVIEDVEVARKLSALRKEASETNEKLRDAGNDKRRSKQEERLADAITTMMTLFSGLHGQGHVYGKLVDLCRPIQRKYSTAVSVAAGKQMDAIVVDTRDTAVKCMNYLKDQKVGVCHFLPLDNIFPSPVSEKLRSFGKEYKPCVDLVDCDDDKFRPAILYAIGNVVVCETLTQAQELCFGRKQNVKVVTIAGHVISKSGAMTGGSSFSSDGGGGRWELQTIQKLRERATGLSVKIAELENACNSRQGAVDLETKIRSLQAMIQFNEADLLVNEQKLLQLSQQKALREETLRVMIKDMDLLRKDINILDRQLSQFQARIRQVENEVFANFSHRMGVTNIREFEEHGMRRIQDLQLQLASVTKHISQLTSQLDYEGKRDFQSILNRLSVQLGEADVDRLSYDNAERSLLQKETLCRTAVKVANEKLEAIREDKASVMNSMLAAQNRRSELQSEREVLAKKEGAENSMIERGRAQLHEVLQKARVDEVALPTLDVSSDASVSGGNAEGDHILVGEDPLCWTGNQSQSEQFRDKTLPTVNSLSSGNSDDDSGGSSSGRRSSGQGSTHFSQSSDPTVKRDLMTAKKVDLSSVRKQKLSKSMVIGKETQLARGITELLAELETIQPNMHAAERYDAVLDKLNECSRELESVRDAAKDIVARFEEVRRTRQQLYMDCYNHVSESLGLIYKDLTRSSKHPLGGQAYLTLDNQDEGYLAGIRFTAMPPMKRFRDMEQLSGGEKTMAALALLFSIHSFRQAPFFVLDEVDAALDNVNVKKICNYIKHRSRDFQCIVISLKDMFFEHAECLVGVCKDVKELSTQVLTLDLKQYVVDAPAAVGNRTDRPHHEVDENEDDEHRSSFGTPLLSSHSFLNNSRDSNVPV